MSIYLTALDKVYDGKKFSIDLKKRSLKVDGRFLIKDGEYEGELIEEDGDVSLDNIYEHLDDAFYAYYHSIPSERTDSQRMSYFKALKEKDMSDEDMMYGEPREVAQFKLEMLLLVYILEGVFVWDNNDWFWQSRNFKEFVILREWVVGE